MAPRKTERLMNLFITLLVSRQYLPKEKIREAVEGYRGQNDQAFDRMFERDKDELRELGITVETGSNDKFFEDDIGYRIKRDEVELPDIELTREQSAVVGLAAQVWEHAGLASDSTAALVKLKAAGIEFINTDTKPFYDATAPVRAKYGAQFAGLMQRINDVK